MPDHLTPAQRHLVMSHIHGKGTKPELKVRQWLWHHGYRYRLNVKSVPGKPDIVLRKYRTAIFVNGCFWHGHQVEWKTKNGTPKGSPIEWEVKWGTENSPCCKIPETNREFWVNKIRRNQERDQRNYQLLQDNGWQVIVVWECQLKPKVMEQTMLQMELLLNENFLRIHQHKRQPFIYQQDQDTELPMAAEKQEYYVHLPHKK